VTCCGTCPGRLPLLISTCSYIMKIDIAFILSVVVHSTSSAVACDALNIWSLKSACEGISTLVGKCHSQNCRRARHWLAEPEMRECYVVLKMGPASDLNKYIELNKECLKLGQLERPRTIINTAKSAARVRFVDPPNSTDNDSLWF
jgi:hypothetical protein